MKRSLLFCRPNRCTGCLLCEMACSLFWTDACGREHSLIRVLTHPHLGTSQPLILERCHDVACEMRCVQSCTTDALLFAPESQWAELLADSQWRPVPVLPETKGS